MPDITAAKPAAGQPIETAWGTQVHDQIEGVQAGKASCTLSAATSGTVAVTFPRAYTVAPIVVATAVLNGNVWANVASITTTGCTLIGRSPTAATTTFDINWVAIGTPA